MTSFRVAFLCAGGIVACLPLVGCTVKQQARAAEVPSTYDDCLRYNAIADEHRKEIMATIYILEHEDPLSPPRLLPTPPVEYDCEALRKL